MNNFDFKKRKFESGGLRWEAKRDGLTVCSIANKHSFNMYPTDGRKYGVQVQGNSELSGRSFRRLRDAKQFLDSNYQLIVQSFEQ